MKKIIIRGILILVVLIIVAFVALGLFLDDAIKGGIVTVGPKLTRTTVSLDSVKLSLLSGAGTIRGLAIGNPQGYKAPTAISIGTLRLGIEPASLLSDKIIVRGLIIDSPHITLETDLKHDNLQQILDNLEAATGGGATNAPQTEKESKAANRKLEVDDLQITDGQVTVSVTGVMDQSATARLKLIHLSDLGTNADGITPVELSKVILKEIEKSAMQSASGAVTDIKKGAIYFSKDSLKGGSNTTEKATKALDSLFKKN